MSTPQTTTSTAVAMDIRRHLFRRLLPLLGTGLLLFWLSDGFLNMNSQLLFQLSVQFSALWSAEGIELLLPLLILGGQILAMGAAWGMLLWLALREGTQLLSMLTRKGMQPGQAVALVVPGTGAKPANLPAGQAQPVGMQPMLQAPAHGQESVVISNWQSRLMRPSPPPGSGVQATPVPSRRGLPIAHRLVPGRVQISSIEVVDTPAQQIGQVPVQMRLLEQSKQERSASEAARSVVRPNSLLNSEDEEQEIDEQEQEDTNFSAVLSALGFLLPMQAQPGEIAGAEQESAKAVAPVSTEAMTVASPVSAQPGKVAQVDAAPLKEARQADKKKAAARKEAGSPYDVQGEASKVFEDGKLLKAMSEVEEEEQGGEPDQIFVFGNPFDGPLPDVFQHDEELKRSILEQNETVQKPRASRGQTSAKARAKKPRTDASVPPQKHS